MYEVTINIFVIIIFTGILGLLWYKGKKELVKKIILSLVIHAENYWGSGTGKIKFAEVMALTYERLPWVIRFFITTDTITRWIEDAVVYIKTEWLMDNATTIEQSLSKQ